MFATDITRDTVDQIVSDWPEKPRKTVERTIKKYGAPDEATESMLVWHENDPWKKTIICRDEVPHDFPKPHSDLLEQFIDYKVPPEKFDELARYDGSVIVERTKGVMSARCDREEANFLALNLAHDIIEGKRSIEDARAFYAENVKNLMKGQPGPYMQGFQFTLPTGDTADPDETVIKEAMEE
jgi:hypothetical protein